VDGPSAGYLGIVVETQQDFDYPFPVAVDTSEIGGPSAGLAMTLGIVDTLSSGHLTGGRTVAATGTITPTGAVGDVGGVAQKTVAVERAGATVFFVPPEELATAKSKDVPSLHIYAVSSLDQALDVLQRLGGQVPPAPVQPGETPHRPGATS
jgi:PDZ domain-containing protein